MNGICNKKGIIIFFVMIFLIGTFTALGYGDYLDRTSEKEILYANIEEYAERIAGEECEVVRILNERGIVKISESVEKDHGIAMYYPLVFLILVDEYDMHLSNVLWYVYTSFIYFYGLICLYLLCRRLQFSEWVSCIAVLTAWLHPRMFAESHYNNKDMVLLALSFMLFYWGHRFVENRKWNDCAIFAIIGAFVSNMKIIGLWIFGIIGMYYLVYIIWKKQLKCKTILKGFICIVVWLACYILLTPGCWGDIIEFLRYEIAYAANFSRWDDYILFQGKLISATTTGIPRRYLPKMILITTPLLILLMIIYGYLQLFADVVSQKRVDIFKGKSYIFVLSTVGIIPLIYAVLSATPVYNGWRHLYFSYASMIMAATYGCDRIVNGVKHVKKRKCFMGLYTFYYTTLAVSIAMNYPHEHSYYNILAGKNVVNEYELDYWEVSVGQALKAIDKKQPEGTKVKVGTLNLVSRWGVEGNYDTLQSNMRDSITIVDDWKNADYVVINPSYAVMYNKEQYEYIMQEYQLFYRAQSYGNAVCEVYSR